LPGHSIYSLIWHRIQILNSPSLAITGPHQVLIFFMIDKSLCCQSLFSENNSMLFMLSIVIT
jgi:hypothetical protein